MRPGFCVAWLLAGGVLFSQQIEMKPFAMDWENNVGSAADVSFLLEKPAGKDGFVRVSNGHLVKPDGQRFRIWGVNITMAANLPSHEQAPVVAAHLARFGLNAVRMHFLDRPAPVGLIDAPRADTRAR